MSVPLVQGVLELPPADPEYVRAHELGPSRGPDAHPKHWPCARIDSQLWVDPASDLLTFDHVVHEAEDLARARACPVRLCIHESTRAPTAVRQIVLRYQRLFLRWCPDEDERTMLHEALVRHRALHDLGKPLVRADYEHAIDVWQWVLRIEPRPSLALQVAALFHDVERLASEADQRIEHQAQDYVRFKHAHAAAGSRMLVQCLRDVPLGATLARAMELVARHEAPEDDGELRVLNDADALSFFALNSAGFLRYYGEEHTRMKVRYTLARLRPTALVWLSRMRLPASVDAWVTEELAVRAQA